MVAKDDAFRLVQSLSKSEKRFFRLFSSATGGEKNYLKLFDVLDKMKTFDDDLLKKKLQGESFLKNLSFEKNYLVKILLRALRVFHSESDATNTLYARMADIHILSEKGLTDMSREATRKTR